MNLWRLEWLRLRRTWRGAGVLCLFLFFGLLGPFTARYLGEILERFGSGEVQISFPEPVPVDGMIQYVSNVQQIGLLAVIGVAAGAFTFDAAADVATFLRSRVPASRVLLTRYAVYVAFGSLAFVLGGLAAWYETAVLLGGLDAGSVLTGLVLAVPFYAWVLAVVALVAGLARGMVGVVVLSLTAVVGPSLLLSLVGPIEPWLPLRLGGALIELNQDESPGGFVRPLAVALAMTAACLFAAVRLFGRREV